MQFRVRLPSIFRLALARSNQTEWMRYATIKNDSALYQYLSFYKYEKIDPNGLESFQKELQTSWKSLNVLGRIYLSQEGINAQLILPEPNIQSLVESFPNLIDKDQLFLGQRLHLNNEQASSLDPSQVWRSPFEKLDIRIRRQIVRDGAERMLLDVHDSGRALPPDIWHQKLTQNWPKNQLLLDVRNAYEHEVGRFIHATRIMVNTFQETFNAIDTLLQRHEVENGSQPHRILIYCTGGIRCEKAGAYLKQHKGIEYVEKLQGGINNYVDYVRRHSKESLFKGKNFVFDQRCVQNTTTDELIVTSNVLGHCIRCGKSSNTHHNCSNEMCGALFILCESCSQSGITCSDGCQQVVNVMRSMDDAQCRAYRKNHAAQWKPPNPNAFRTGGNRDKRMCTDNILLHNSYSTLSSGKSGKSSMTKCAVPFDEKLDEYLESISSNAFENKHHSSDEMEQSVDLLERVRTQTRMELLKPEQMAFTLQGKLLGFLTTLIGAECALEIGTFSGYSALCIAGALPPYGKLWTCDRDRMAIAFTEKYLGEYARRNLIELVHLDALSFLQNANSDDAKFDLIYLDANKRTYCDCYDYIITNNLLTSRGLYRG
uniref:Uncharacterized protein AlNc14C22G2271 n=1 Tax=Albugo laibachii Nc14 TaxID=890382 RepID=F0W5V6_9STRA|nr:conserved hypothetical protein [Albugo laibachii Nc14]|eukprot:CCA16497.1 conserved hypothetical protein [Albugo laibachii Nc14]